MISTILTWKNYRSGHFDWHIKGHEEAMYAGLNEILESETFDMMMGIFSPHFHFKHCAQFSAKFQIPFVMDFRDLWHNQTMNPNHEFPLRQRKQHKWIQHYWKTWSENMSGFISVAPAFVDYLSTLFEKPGISILNGFDGERPDPIEKFARFTIGHFGRLLPGKEIGPLMAGLAKFKNDHRRPINLVFYAADDELQDRVIAMATQFGIAKMVSFQPKVPRKEAVRLMGLCHLLYYPPIIGHKGMYSAKIFDYLGSGSRLLICPDDGDVVANLVTDTATGEVLTTPMQVSNFIHRSYIEWEDTGTVCCPGDPTAIFEFSRREQVRKLADFLSKLASPSSHQNL
jgi:hypothetical protein